MEAINVIGHNHKKITEEELIKRILKGEKELYEILIRRHNQKLYRIVRAYLKNDAEIEDVMQNSYIKAFINLHQFNSDSQFSTWLIRIAINESLAELKKNGRTLHVNSYSHNPEKEHILEIPDHKQLNPQEKMSQKETKQLVENAIDHLDIKYRTVYIMKEIEEMSLQEISTTLGISLSNVKIRLHRSKVMLKESLYSLSSSAAIFEFGFSRCDRITENVMNKISNG